MKTIVFRVAAVFGYSSLAAVAGGAIVNVSLWKSAFIAGAVATSNVVGKLLQAYANDGKIDRDELNDAFGGKVKK